MTIWLCAPLPNVQMARTSITNDGPYSDARPTDLQVSILVYHRFGPIVADSMTVRTAAFRWQLQYRREHGCPVIPLQAVVAWRLGLGPPPPARSVVITADDGHRSVFTEMMPLVRSLPFQ